MANVCAFRHRTDHLIPTISIEFLGEGLRKFDQMRLLLTIPAKGPVAAKAPGEPGYIWPITADEMSLNPLMTDN